MDFCNLAYEEDRLDLAENLNRESIRHTAIHHSLLRPSGMWEWVAAMVLWAMGVEGE